jgi:hypothetical protein
MMMRGLAYVHPGWMVIAITLAAVALRAGLLLRRSRRLRTRRATDLRARHLRFAKPAVAMLLVGFIAGPISAFTLRGWGIFESFHGWVALACIGLFLATARVGRELEHGRSRAFEVHALLGLLAMLFASVAAVAGFSLLP